MSSESTLPFLLKSKAKSGSFPLIQSISLKYSTTSLKSIPPFQFRSLYSRSLFGSVGGALCPGSGMIPETGV